MSNQANNPPWIKDAALSFVGGVNGAVPPQTIGRDQVTEAWNATMRGGRCKPRHGYQIKDITFSGSIESAFRMGNFQHAGFYDGNGYPSLISSHGGRLFKYDIRTNVIQEITPTTANSPAKTIGWSTQAENYWIYQDNESLPIIFDGATARRAVPSNKEIPVGNVMAYANGRLIVARPDRISYRVGDLVFSSSGTAAKEYRDSILRFTENEYANEGGEMQARVFGANSVYGNIVCIKPLAMCDTQLGQGPAMIGQANMIFTIALPFDRTTWKDLANPLQTASPLLGPLSDRATVNVNGDLWYRSIDGIRSFIQARRDFTSWGNTPMSSEIGDMLAGDTEDLLEYSSAALFDNRLMMTISPVRSAMGIWHRGMAVIDFNLVSTMRGKASPAWEGFWTGLRILQVIQCTVDKKERCFIYALNDSNEIEIWEMVKGLKQDNGTTPIQWSFTQRSMDFGNIEQFKRLETGRMTVVQLSGQLDWVVKYRSNESPCFQDWDNGTACAQVTDCSPPTCAGPHTYRPQQRHNIRFRQPPDGFDDATGWKYRTGYHIQPRIDLTGYAEVESLFAYAVDEPENISRDRLI